MAKKGKFIVDKGPLERFPIRIIVLIEWEEGFWSVMEKIETNEENVNYFKKYLSPQIWWGEVEWERPFDQVYAEYMKQRVES